MLTVWNLYNNCIFVDLEKIGEPLTSTDEVFLIETTDGLMLACKGNKTEEGAYLNWKTGKKYNLSGKPQEDEECEEENAFKGSLEEELTGDDQIEENVEEQLVEEQKEPHEKQEENPELKKIKELNEQIEKELVSKHFPRGASLVQKEGDVYRIIVCSHFEDVKNNR